MLLVLAIFMTSCNNTENRMSIDDGDSIVQCVVDSTWSSGSRSSIQPDPIFYFRTECGNTHCTNKCIYKVGDTITYVWKKKN